jgi:hypothetical protein
MKKSKYISLVLITAALASCNQKEEWNEDEPKVYMRSDSTANYSRSHHATGIGTAILWYYAFRPYGRFENGAYNKTGYYSRGISEHSNIGSNTGKTSIVRGGFGRGSTVSS